MAKLLSSDMDYARGDGNLYSDTFSDEVEDNVEDDLNDDGSSNNVKIFLSGLH